MRNLLCLLSLFVTTSVIAQPLNIIWIVIEDASPHIGCYGETAIETPTLDQMAAHGVRFESAFVAHLFVHRVAPPWSAGCTK